MTAVKIVMGVALVLLIAALALTLSKAPFVVSKVSSEKYELLRVTSHAVSACQSGETLPRGTSAVRLGIDTFLGPRVNAVLSVGGEVIAKGERGAGWTGDVVTIPIHPLNAVRSGVSLCYEVHSNGVESATYAGERSSRAVHGLPGRLRVEYLRPSDSDWGSRIVQVARRMGLGHAPSGFLGVLMIGLAMGGLLVLSAGLMLRELR